MPGPVRILVVDDNKDIRSLTHFLLGREFPRATIEEAPDAETALGKFRDQRAAGNPFDLVVTDHQMGKMSGLELLRILKRESGAPRSILMSASTEAEDIARKDDAVGFFLRKPFDLRELVAAARAG